ncbi:MAG: phosphotransferase [Ignavibacteria bacterium]
MSYKSEIILNTFQELQFSKFGQNLDGIKELKPDASDRKIYRLTSDQKTYIGIYNDNPKENLAFIGFTESFLKSGLNVPEIISVSNDNLFYIVEDLGDLTLYKLMKSGSKDDLQSYFKKSLSDLLKFQIVAKDEIDYSLCYQTEEFNSEVVRSDLEKFNNYFPKIYSAGKFNDDNVEEIVNKFSGILSKVDCNFFLYRDFQPRNIMIKKGDLYYIDYQSGRKGPLHYDAASFLYSGSIDLEDDERESLLTHYLNLLHNYLSYDEKEFRHYFYYFVFLRLLQAIGSYCYQHETKNDNEILRKVAKALNNLKSLQDKIDDELIRSILDFRF